MAEVLTAVLGILGGGLIGIATLTVPGALVWAIVAGAAFSLAGAGLPSRKPEFLAFAGVLLGVGCSMLVSGTAVALGLGAFAGRVGARGLSHRGLRGALMAAVAGVPLMYGAVAVGHPAAGALPWLLASWIQAVREMLEARATGLAATLALLFVPVSLLLPARSGYAAPFFLVAMFAQLALLVVGTRLIVGRMDRLTGLLNGARIVGLVALIAGRVV